MAKTKIAKPKKKPATERNGVADEVLTLAEAAAWLKVGESDLAGLAFTGAVPGRRIGAEWRFLKSALTKWFRRPAKPSGKERLLALAGSMKGDPYMEDMLKEIYRRRGRPMTEAGE